MKGFTGWWCQPIPQKKRPGKSENIKPTSRLNFEPTHNIPQPSTWFAIQQYSTSMAAPWISASPSGQHHSLKFHEFDLAFRLQA